MTSQYFTVSLQQLRDISAKNFKTIGCTSFKVFTAEMNFDGKFVNEIKF